MAAGKNEIGPVVVGIDGSDASLVALARAVREAEWRGVKLHVLHALDVTPAVLHLKGDVAVSTRVLAESDREEVWKLAQPLLGGAGTNVVQVDRDGKPVDALVAYCDEIGASVLVVGPRGRGKMAEMLLGSTAQGVIKKAHCDVLLAKLRT